MGTPAVLVARGERVHLGRGADHGSRDDKRHQGRRGHDQREPLDRARLSAARPAALCRAPDGPADREVLRWILRGDLAPALQALADSGAPIAADVLIGIKRRTTASVPASSVRPPASSPPTTQTPSDRAQPSPTSTRPLRRQRRHPLHHLARAPPSSVRTLDRRPARAFRHAVYDRARSQAGAHAPMLWLLDEMANIAPIHDLPALVSQAGGQNLQVMIGLQDLSQARERWGDAAADGFMSLFQTKVVLNGIGDSRTLESISMTLGEYDRDTVAHSLGRSDPQEWFATTTQRHRRLPNPTPTSPHTGRDRTPPRRPRTAAARRRLAAARPHALAPKRAMEDDRRGTRIIPVELPAADPTSPGRGAEGFD